MAGTGRWTGSRPLPGRDADGGLLCILSGMDRTDNAAHWDRIFDTTEKRDLGWFEASPSTLLAMLDGVESRRAFLAGAGTSGLAAALLPERELVINDLSAKAIDLLRAELGDPADVQWICQDIALPLPAELEPVDLWVDRAVLHFLTGEDEIQGYLANLRRLVKPAGHVLLAEFAQDGAVKCAGLPVHRYSLQEMLSRMEGFELLAHREEVFLNPKGDPRPYLYALFRRL